MKTSDQGKQGSNRQPLERVTVNFIPRASAALARGTEITKYSKTDFINRAVQAYTFLEEEAGRGHEILIRDESGEVSRIVFA